MLCHYIHIYFVLLSGHQGRRSWAVQFMVQCFNNYNNYRFSIARFRGRWSWREPRNWRLSVKSVVFSKIPRNITTFSFIRSRATDQRKNTNRIFSAWHLAHYTHYVSKNAIKYTISRFQTKELKNVLDGLNSRPRPHPFNMPNLMTPSVNAPHSENPMPVRLFLTLHFAIGLSMLSVLSSLQGRFC